MCLYRAGVIQAHVRDGDQAGMLSGPHHLFATGTLGSYTLRGKLAALLVPREASVGAADGDRPFPLPWVSQEAKGSFWKERAIRAGGELPVTGGVHLEKGDHLWSWCWAIPAQVGSELGAEAPSGLGVQRTTEQLWGDGSTLGGSPLVMFGSSALPRLKISNKAGLLVPADLLRADPRDGLKGTFPTGGT